MLSVSALLSAFGGGHTALSAQTRTVATKSNASTSNETSTVTPEFTALMEKNAQFNAAELKREQKNSVFNIRSIGSVQAQMADTVIPVYRALNKRQALANVSAICHASGEPAARGIYTGEHNPVDFERFRPLIR